MWSILSQKETGIYRWMWTNEQEGKEVVMKREPNLELDRFVLDALAEKYTLTEKREGIHLSSLNYCLTKAYLDLHSPILPTDTELLLFATGYGLETVLTHSIAERLVLEEDGILYRPDNVLPATNAEGKKMLVEMKSTRSGVKRYREGDLPDTWVTYMKAGCHIMKQTVYNLCVIYVAERPTAQIVSETITFTDEEIAENWAWILTRRDAYVEALETDTIPTPYEWNESWQCNNCRYSLICDSIILLKKRGG